MGERERVKIEELNEREAGTENKTSKKENPRGSGQEAWITSGLSQNNRAPPCLHTSW